MDAFSSVATSRPSWSKTLTKKKTSSHTRKEPAVTLPALTRRPTVQQNTSLHAFLTSQLEGNARDVYSRSQLRAMTSSKLISNSNNNLVPTNSRIHSFVERLAPLDRASFEKTKARHRRPLPDPLEAAIDEVLAVRNDNSDGRLSERGESRDDSNNNDEPHPPIPKVKRTSSNNSQLQGRRPEWRRYIRRIMMTKGIQGSTLARYRRLVGIVARKSLNQTYDNAAERVVRYRLEFRSAAMIQTMILRYLKRRRQEEELRKHQAVVMIQTTIFAVLKRRRQEKALQEHHAAAKIQLMWRMVLERENQRQSAKRIRLAKLDRLLRLGATRSIQRIYRHYRQTCYLHQEDQNQRHQASKIQRARVKLLERYQMWRKKSKQEKIGQNLTLVGAEEELSGEHRVTEKDNHISLGLDNLLVTSPCGHVNEVMSCDSIPTNESPCDSAETHQDILDRTEMISGTFFNENNEGLDGISGCLNDFVTVSYEHEAVLLQGQSTDMNDNSNDVAPKDSVQDNQGTVLPHSSCLESNQNSSEIVSVAVEAILEPENDNERGNAGVDAMEKVSGQSEDHRQSFTDLVGVIDENSVLEFAAIPASKSMARIKAGKIITRFLLPMVQARVAKNSVAVIKIQCVFRQYLARQRMIQVRLEALTSLRQQLFASWQIPLQNVTNENLIATEQNTCTQRDEIEEEDDELDTELRDYRPSLLGVSDVYIHVLPTRNGQIPPGVPVLQSNAGSSLISLWKWSWSSEKWLSNGY